MSNNTINAALRRLGYASDEQTGHGFRSVASRCQLRDLDVTCDSDPTGAQAPRHSGPPPKKTGTKEKA
jgi:hypothetical protein